MQTPRRGRRGSMAILGFGANNQPLLPYLLNRGHRVVVADRVDASTLVARIRGLDVDPERVRVLAGTDYLTALARLPDLEAVFVTPGMRKDGPEFAAMRRRGIRVTCETDLFLGLCPAPVLGITGSAGKTTTTTLLGEAFRRAGDPVWVGGNIGRSLLPEVPRMAEGSRVVMELSSFQLELAERSPHGALITNLRPNHLDIHQTFDAYAEAKARIFLFQSTGDFAVFPWRDPVVEALWKGRHRGDRAFFSTEALPGDVMGAGVVDGWLLWQGSEVRRVIPVDRVRLPGRHNLANAAAAAAVLAMADGNLDALGEVLAEFTGVPHRLELVREHDGVRFINDSIATSPDRSEAALAAVAGALVLIAGGYDKHLDYAGFGEAVVRRGVRVVVLVGQTKEKIRVAIQQAATRGGPAILEAADFSEAVLLAARSALPGDTVLLSPASASYDMFTNFEVRGQRFRELVGEL